MPRLRLPARTVNWLYPVHSSLAHRLVYAVSIGLCLGFLLVALRARILGLRLQDVLASFDLLRWVALGSYYDVVYVASLTGVFATGMWLARRSPGAQRALSGAYSLAAVASLIAGFVNLHALRALGGPLTYQWLHYSDFLRSLDARQAIAAHVSPSLLALVGLACVGMLVGAGRLSWAVHQWAPVRGARWLLAGTVAASLLYLTLAASRWDRMNASEARLSNPVVAFIASIGSAHRSPYLSLLAGAAASRPDGVPLAPDDRREEGTPDSLLFRRAANAKLRNVVIFVLESVPAEYIGAYGATLHATPQIDRYASQARRFVNHYAHGPSTDAALVSLLLSIYPRISYRGLTVAQPDVHLPSLSSELDRQGYRTAFLNAADNRFQNFDRFLSHRGMDVVADHLGLKCARHGAAPGTRNRPFPETADDTCLVTAFDEWVREAPSARFFAVLWTLQTHYPYFSSGTQRQFGVKARGLNRYLNALHQSDQVFGQLMRTLENRGLLASTLVVVVGDHGEAFGQHGRRVHGELLYEEDLRIPLLLVNPRLFGGEVDSVVSGMKDVAPTVLDLLGYPTPRVWQGRSLIRGGRSDRAYFFSLRSDFRFGFRDGRHKLLFNATENRAELYDLVADPRESANLAPRYPALVQAGVQHLADWIRSHDRFLTDPYAEAAQQQGPVPPRR